MGNMCTGSERKPYSASQHHDDPSDSDRRTVFQSVDFFGKKSAGNLAFSGQHAIEENFSLCDNFPGSTFFIVNSNKPRKRLREKAAKY